MAKEAFRPVDTWVFDLDNTLYPPEAGLFAQMNPRINGFIRTTLGISEDEAAVLRKSYWQQYGTTLSGLMAEHGVEPLAYLDEVHDIDLSTLTPAPDLHTALNALPGRKIVFTNGTREHAKRVTRARGIDGAFDAIYGVEDADFVPKPKEAAFARVFELAGVLPRTAAMFEDSAHNLQVPHAWGMRTVLVGPPEDGPHIHHQTEDLAGFLSQLA
ncbi:pyrimidine 5'-nucleotidase [Oceanibium sediminis]|uniref:pyrimidine 5'-nucleotidase n=1 Tax=Oceanibium sediminis TaxID=2026339 RepID=UPI000DD4CDB6|nr:pyrimidine 5'-nucleotidase [Oceanibium sediminis]